MRRKAGGEIANPEHAGAAGGSSTRGTVPAYEIATDDFQRHALDGEATRARNEEPPGSLEIEFEDDGAAESLPHPAGRSRDLRPAAMTTLATAVLGAALWATHGATAPGPSLAMHFSAQAPAPDYAAFSVVVGYHDAYIVDAGQRRIDVNLHVSPVRGAKVRIIAYYISENGVIARADPPPSVTPLPVTGMNVKLELTVTNCATVPIGESMGFVDVVADGPAGVIDRFTILGERYSTDLANLLRRVCPGRADGQGPNTIGVVVSGP
ncbi:MAG TPA: hypothetical protein VFU74_16430 [Actinocrinis sp.]|nr:hypothetical protein [Actinocrinis sp.]